MSVKGYEYNNVEAAIYGAIYPFTWGASIAWIIYATEIKLGGKKLRVVLFPLLEIYNFQAF